MNSSVSKNRRKIGQPQKVRQSRADATPDKGEWVRAMRRRMTVFFIDLHRTTESKDAAKLTRDLLGVTKRHIQELSENDVLIGATTAAALTALACGMTHAEFVGWLRRYASHVERRSKELERVAESGQPRS
jgi:hypothetical protein